MAHGLLTVTQELLLHGATEVSLLRQEAQKLLSKPGPSDDMEAYLYIFEQTTLWENWAEEEWAQVLTPLLTGEAQWACHALPPVTANDYQFLKGEILAQCGLSPCQVTSFSLSFYH